MRGEYGVRGGGLVSIRGVLAGAAAAAFMTGVSAPAHANDWQIDSVASQCAASVVVGTIVGGLIGAAAGHGRGGAVAAGAIGGGAAGGLLCAVVASLDAQDRERIRRAQLDAAKSGKPRALVYQGSDGLQRRVTVNPVGPPPPARKSTPGRALSSAEQAAARGQKICRKVETSVSVETKGQAEVPAQTVCRNAAGDWEPVASQVAGG